MIPVRASVQVIDQDTPRAGQAGVALQDQDQDLVLVRFDLEDEAGQRDELVAADQLQLLGTN